LKAVEARLHLEHSRRRRVWASSLGLEILLLALLDLWADHRSSSDEDGEAVGKRHVE
jgi:hypothetical protein